MSEYIKTLCVVVFVLIPISILITLVIAYYVQFTYGFEIKTKKQFFLMLIPFYIWIKALKESFKNFCDDLDENISKKEKLK